MAQQKTDDFGGPTHRVAPAVRWTSLMAGCSLGYAAAAVAAASKGRMAMKAEGQPPAAVARTASLVVYGLTTYDMVIKHDNRIAVSLNRNININGPFSFIFRIHVTVYQMVP